jgi:S1-C subfamily serine protease
MHRLTSVALILCVFSSVVHADDRAQIVARAKLSIAKVIATSQDNESVGTAFLFTSTVYPPGGRGLAAVEKGNLLTNCHVVRGALKVEVQFMEPVHKVFDAPPANILYLPWEAKVLGCDQLSDLAVLEFGPGAANQSLFSSPAPLPFANPGDIHPGDEVLTLGFALNLGGDPSVNRGIISAVNRGFPSEHDCEGETNCLPGVFSGLIQTDATINHGNSGGPMLNMKGEVVGINTYTTSGKGPINVFYARSVETVKPFAKMLLTNGQVIRADLGIDGIASVPADPHRVVLKHGGVKILSFAPNSPGQKAGLRVGDIILKVWSQTNGLPRMTAGMAYTDEVRDIGSLMNLLAFVPPKTVATVEVFTPDFECSEVKAVPPCDGCYCVEKDLGRRVSVQTE